MTVKVPSIYQQYVAQAAAATGLPQSVVAAQIDYESGFNPNAVSPTGAEGIAQFEPGTWSSYGTGSPFDPKAAFAAYAKYMKTLLDQFHGNVTDALEAYNAGPGNLQAGAGYAQHILSVAGQPGGIQLTGDTPNGANGGANTGTNAQDAGLGSWFQKFWSWVTPDPLQQLLQGGSSLTGTLGSGIEQGLARAFMDILVALWQKVMKPLFWVFEILGGIVVMIVALAILTARSPVGSTLSSVAGVMPGPLGLVAKGSNALMQGSLPRRGQSQAPSPAKPSRPAAAPKQATVTPSEAESQATGIKGAGPGGTLTRQQREFAKRRAAMA